MLLILISISLIFTINITLIDADISYIGEDLALAGNGLCGGNKLTYSGSYNAGSIKILIEGRKFQLFAVESGISISRNPFSQIYQF